MLHLISNNSVNKTDNKWHVFIKGVSNWLSSLFKQPQKRVTQSQDWSKFDIPGTYEDEQGTRSMLESINLATGRQVTA